MLEGWLRERRLGAAGGERVHTRLHSRRGMRHPAAACPSLRRPGALAWAEARPSPSPRGRGHMLRSAADHATVCFADDHGGGTRAPLAVQPGADCRRLVGIAPLAGGLARVLDVDKHALAIWRRYHASDFAAVRSGQKAADLASGGIRRQHLVVAHIGIVVLVEHAGRDVRLNPEHATCVEPEPIRGTKNIPFDGAVLVGFGHGGVAAEHENVPLEPVGLGITVLFAPADDMTIDVLGARIGWVDRRALVRTTGAVIGERAIDLLGGWVDRNPLRTVHLCGTNFVCCGAGLHHDLRLAREARSRVEAVLAVD